MQTPQLVEQTHYNIGELLGYFRYAALDYMIKTAMEPVSAETLKANKYAITLRRIWDFLDGLDSKTIESMQLELDGLVMGERHKQRKADLRAVRTIVQEYLTIDSWAVSKHDNNEA